MSAMRMSKSSAVASTREAVLVRPAAMASPVVRAASNTSARRGVAFAPSTVPPASRITSLRASAATEPASTSAATKQEWYALVANQEFFFNDVQNEAVAEQLRERVRFYKEQNKENDFYLVPDPVWLDSKYPQQAKQVKRPCVALVSTDKMWIVFMKVRLDRVLRIDLGDMPKSEVLKAGGKVAEFKKPEKWTAPYAPYSKGWWEPFLPPM